MKTKFDPYATKIQKRIDLLLLIFIVVLAALLLRPAAKAETPTPDATVSMSLSNYAHGRTNRCL